MKYSNSFKIRPFIIAVLFILVSSPQLLGQEITIKGVVKDHLNKPLNNVSVKINNGDTEVFTDASGFYNITVPEKSKLVFSSEGFKTKKVSTKGKDVINISLKFDEKPYEEKEVNTGYGKIKQSE